MVKFGISDARQETRKDLKSINEFATRMDILDPNSSTVRKETRLERLGRGVNRVVDSAIYPVIDYAESRAKSKSSKDLEDAASAFNNGLATIDQIGLLQSSGYETPIVISGKQLFKR